MGSQESKQEVIYEQVNVNAGTITADEKIRVLTTTEIYGVAVLAVVTCFGAAKIIQKYFKKAVQQYSINQV
jgi:hypothetical protein